MTSGLVTVGRRKYAVGLYWENSAGGNISQAAREAARQSSPAAPYYAVRQGAKTGRLAQFGLAADAPGLSYGMPVLAACLANQQPGSWVGAFRLHEGVALVIVRDDLIVPDGDLFFTDENEARDRLVQEVGFGGLQRIYAPDAWGVPGVDTMPLALLLSDQTDVTLKPVKIPRNILLGLIFGGLVLTGILGAGWYYQEKKAQEEADMRARQVAMEKAQEAARRMVPQVLQNEAVSYPPPDRKWEKVPRGLDMIQACQNGLIKVPMAVIGWRLNDLKCDGKAIVLSWSKEPGYAPPPPDATVAETGMTAVSTVALEPLTPRGAEDLKNATDITRRILVQDWNARLVRASPDPLPPPPPDFKGKWDPPPAPWVKRSFTLNAPVLPWVLPTFFGDLPGLIVTGVSCTGTKGPWKIEGVIYENNR